MRYALSFAKKGKGFTSPNPCVGAIIVKNGKIIGEGFHQRAGSPHAEINAIRFAKKRDSSTKGATLYVTLEPCSTFGRTPPCTEAILKEKFSRVVIATKDPNPKHAGRGIAFLRRAGMQVDCGLLANESAEMNRDFNHWITTDRPWVVGKIAQSLDGRIKTPETDDRWLSSKESLLRAHQLRLEADAIMIGAETARVDNPHLTVRLPGAQKKVQPWRIMMTRSGKLPRKLRLFNDEFKERTLVYRNTSFKNVLSDLGKRGVMNLLLEGGGHLLGEALAAGAVNEISFFITPCILGRGPSAVVWPEHLKLKKRIGLKNVRIETNGTDLFYNARQIFLP